MAKANRARKKARVLTPDDIARLVADALTVGNDEAAARWNVSVRTVERHRAKAVATPLADGSLSAVVAKNLEVTAGEWRDVAVEFLRKGIAKLGALIDQAGKEQIRDVAGAVKIVGELQVVREALGVDQPGAAAEGRAAPQGPAEPPRLRVVGD